MSKAKKQKNANKHRALSAQQTIPYIAMHPDGICQLPGGLYTKTLEYEDINYAVASTEDQTAIISGWSACLNYFDSSLPFQLSFVNRRNRNANRYKVNIPAQEDDFNSIRGEYVEMLKGQIAKSNNGIERYKYITFGLPAGGVAEARPRLGRVEADVMGNLKRLGVQSCPLDGRDRLAVLHGQMHPGGREPFRFAWKDIPKTGMGTKDYIAPDSFDFRQSRTFRVGQMWGAASYLQIMASELSDKLLAEILELDAELTVTMHIQTVDQLKAIKTIKGKISDIGRMKVEEQKKAVRAGYDMEILPPDLITFSKDAAELLSDLQSRNERMFLLTFTVVNLAPTRQRLENDVFTVSGIAQKYNCALRRLDWQQEQGFVSSLALGYNGIEIQRGMTTSSTAIFCARLVISLSDTSTRARSSACLMMLSASVWAFFKICSRSATIFLLSRSSSGRLLRTSSTISRQRSTSTTRLAAANGTAVPSSSVSSSISSSSSTFIAVPLSHNGLPKSCRTYIVLPKQAPQPVPAARRPVLFHTTPHRQGPCVLPAAAVLWLPCRGGTAGPAGQDQTLPAWWPKSGTHHPG